LQTQFLSAYICFYLFLDTFLVGFVTKTAFRTKFEFVATTVEKLKCTGICTGDPCLSECDWFQQGEESMLITINLYKQGREALCITRLSCFPITCPFSE